MDRVVPHPLHDFRWINVSEGTDQFNIPSGIDDIVVVDEITSKLDEMVIQKHECKKCPAKYSSEKELKKHMTAKHDTDMPKVVTFECFETVGQKPCGKVLASEKNLKNHIETVHRSCSVCKLKGFANHNEMLQHYSKHTTCQLCG